MGRMGPSRTVPRPARMNPAASQSAEGPELLSLREDLKGMKSAVRNAMLPRGDARCEIRAAWNQEIMMEETRYE
jgi:hypothetical protein